MEIRIATRYARHKAGQKVHIVPVLSGGYHMADTALCGKHVNRWPDTFNVPFGMCCGNCVRINRQRGYQRALEIIRKAFGG